MIKNHSVQWYQEITSQCPCIWPALMTSADRSPWEVPRANTAIRTIFGCPRVTIISKAVSRMMVAPTAHNNIAYEWFRQRIFLHWRINQDNHVTTATHSSVVPFYGAWIARGMGATKSSLSERSWPFDTTFPISWMETIIHWALLGKHA